MPRVTTIALITLLLISGVVLQATSFTLLYQALDEDVDSYTNIVILDGFSYFIGSKSGYLVITRLNLLDFSKGYERVAYHRVLTGNLYILDVVYEADSLQVLAASTEETRTALYHITVSPASGRVIVDSVVSMPLDFRVLRGSLWRGLAVAVGLWNNSLTVIRASPTGVEWTTRLGPEPRPAPLVCVSLRSDGAALIAVSSNHGADLYVVSPAGNVVRHLAYNATAPILIYDCKQIGLAFVIAGGLVLGELIHPILVYTTLDEPVRAGHTIIGDVTGVVTAVASEEDKVYAALVTRNSTLVALYKFSLEEGFNLERAVNINEVAGREVLGLALAVFNSTLMMTGALMKGSGAYLAVIKYVEEKPRLSESLASVLIFSSIIVLAAMMIVLVATFIKKRFRKNKVKEVQ
ncbi:MAG: hypothetical protein QXH25_04745 [Acidilobaceae archaeon]